MYYLLRPKHEILYYRPTTFYIMCTIHAILVYTTDDDDDGDEDGDYNNINSNNCKTNHNIPGL